jgi:hypothetical protein
MDADCDGFTFPVFMDVVGVDVESSKAGLWVTLCPGFEGHKRSERRQRMCSITW